MAAGSGRLEHDGMWGFQPKALLKGQLRDFKKCDGLHQKLGVLAGYSCCSIARLVRVRVAECIFLKK